MLLGYESEFFALTKEDYKEYKIFKITKRLEVTHLS